MDFNAPLGFLIALLLVWQLEIGGLLMLEPVCSSHSTVNLGTSGRSQAMPTLRLALLYFQ